MNIPLQITNLKKRFRKYNPDADIQLVDWKSFVQHKDYKANLRALKERYPHFRWNEEEYNYDKYKTDEEFNKRWKQRWEELEQKRIREREARENIPEVEEAKRREERKIEEERRIREAEEKERARELLREREAKEEERRYFKRFYGKTPEQVRKELIRKSEIAKEVRELSKEKELKLDEAQVRYLAGLTKEQREKALKSLEEERYKYGVGVVPEFVKREVKKQIEEEERRKKEPFFKRLIPKFIGRKKERTEEEEKRKREEELLRRIRREKEKERAYVLKEEYLAKLEAEKQLRKEAEELMKARYGILYKPIKAYEAYEEIAKIRPYKATRRDIRELFEKAEKMLIKLKASGRR